MWFATSQPPALGSLSLRVVKAIVHLCVWVGGVLQVSFNGGAPVFSKYIDTFPFPFYIVLQDIASLPRTLADLLRQWFELTAAN
jgi:hypothetical protein